MQDHGKEEKIDVAASDQQFVALTRSSVAALDAIVGKAFSALDDGFVKVVDYMGDDHSIVTAARVSYGSGTKKVQDDRALIRYLMRHAHTTPFEMCEIKLHVRAPMDTWRQWIRHRTARVNEYSTRYSLAIDAAQRSKPSEWRLQSQDNKQGSAGYVSEVMGKELSLEEAGLHVRARRAYEKRLKAGVAREQARKDLPLSTYTEAYWKIDLHNLLNFLHLRMHKHAQEEIRSYANLIGHEIVAKWVPIAWEAFADRKNAVTFSRIESMIVGAIAAGKSAEAKSLAEEFGMLNRSDDGKLRANRERRELEEKLAAIGMKIDWH
jgi:thymidylate synthase (FAD)